jgi:hypothetical protein
VTFFGVEKKNYRLFTFHKASFAPTDYFILAVALLQLTGTDGAVILWPGSQDEEVEAVK